MDIKGIQENATLIISGGRFENQNYIQEEPNLVERNCIVFGRAIFRDQAQNAKVLLG
jgi:hypothetical protein